MSNCNWRRHLAVAGHDATKNTDDYTLCCPPTDTSPPFIPSEDGLNTTTDHPNLKLVQGNLIFDELSIRDNSGNSPKNATDLTGTSATANRKIKIKTPSGTFKILAFDP